MLEIKGLERYTRQMQNRRAGVEMLSNNNKTNKNQTNHLSQKIPKTQNRMLSMHTKNTIVGS